MSHFLLPHLSRGPRMSLPAILLWAASLSAIAAPLSMNVHLDTRDLPRRLLHSTMEIPVSPGEFIFRYPEWIPGIHAPMGPVENIGGLVLETPEGANVPWTRDPLDRYRFTCTVPGGVKSLRVALDYITNQPSTNSRGVDSFGDSLLGVVNWNTVLVYPEGVASDDITITADVRAPEGWRAATSIPLEKVEEYQYQLTAVSFTRLMDSPVLLGEYLRSIDLDAGDGAPVTLHLGSEAEQALQIKDELIAKYGKMVQEAYLLFGGAHYDRYDFLVACSDTFPYTGLEHLRSSLNGVGERDLLKDDKLKSWVGYLLPHEYVHSWCGKYRRPAGMVRADYHTPKDTRLLWVYEGLTQYLGHVLTVRGGIWEFDHYKEVLADNIGDYMRQEGRQWRSMEDTAADSYHLRGGSPSWSKMRRGQDYYNEGLLFWLDADAIIREKTDGQKSLDDFAKAFLGASGDNPTVFGYGEQDVLDALNDQTPYGWAGLVNSWIKSPQAALPLDFVARLGYRLEYGNAPTAYDATSEKDGNYASAYHSLGMSVNNSGVVHGSLVPGMPADQAGLAPGMTIIGVNGKKFTLDRFRDGVKDSIARGNVELLMLDGDLFKTITIPYDGGARYLSLARIDNTPDRLKDILAPRKK